MDGHCKSCRLPQASTSSLSERPAPQHRHGRSPKEMRRLQCKVNKRRKTVFRKADELWKCGARIYLLVEVNNKRYIYNSEKSRLWPPSPEEIEMESYPLPIYYEPGSLLSDGVIGQDGVSHMSSPCIP
ncbi:hypothetical protein B0T19DRAFT_416180 [Cercophora scortea]|uniref:MADS-box domain-containing protein n=1 Tax=Cercophora scortea TaxID=314031 RepID=A0AAE0IXA3_9PEZI|nr:hypothetical protein B0T19DRAFT_416180 [Cercophora scortea]